MPEIFGRVPLTFGGGFAADAANIFFGTTASIAGGGPADVLVPIAVAPISGVGLLTQNMQFQYQQPIQRIWEVGGAFEYFIAGRTQGTANLGQIVGPRAITDTFYTIFGNVCTGPDNSLLFAGAAGCENLPTLGGANNFAFLIDGVLLQSVGMSVAAQDMIINQQLQFMFISLYVPESSVSGLGGAAVYTF